MLSPGCRMVSILALASSPCLHFLFIHVNETNPFNMPVWPCPQRAAILPARDCLPIMLPIQVAWVVTRDRREALPLPCWAPWLRSEK